MPKPETLTKLRDLHDELARINEDLSIANGIDETTIDTLGQMMTDVGVLVDKYEESDRSGIDLPVFELLVDRINGFESRHPRIDRFLSQLNEILDTMEL